ncbi:MAG: hypothetical protein GEU79_12695 [Acidimicrobiia bacterium]|nr:hypothetical protein [Acidimicrobiia bacterium]
MPERHEHFPRRAARVIRRVLGGRELSAARLGVTDDPIFIGGTGRSGTWVVGRMLGAHETLATLYTELRFHAVPKGFRAVLSGKMSPDEYADSVLDRWYQPPGGSSGPKGLQLIVTRPELKASLDQFRSGARLDVSQALADLMHDLVDAFAWRRRAIRWAETTPDNAAAAHSLTMVFPAAKVIHVVRDGRDAAASVAEMGWGPTSIRDGLEWWGRRMKTAQQGMAAADPERTLTIRLEELIYLDRERTFERLAAFAGVGGSEPVLRYFEENVNAGAGKVGRWHTHVQPNESDLVDGRYRELLAELTAEGGSALPVEPERVDEVAIDQEDTDG